MRKLDPTGTIALILLGGLVIPAMLYGNLDAYQTNEKKRKLLEKVLKQEESRESRELRKIFKKWRQAAKQSKSFESKKMS